MNIERFCATQNDSRDWLKKPFRFDHQSYACDGHILVTVNVKADLVDERKRSDLMGMIERTKTHLAISKDWISVGAIRVAEEQCNTCRGTGKTGGSCEACEGKGVADCKHCGNESNCVACDMSGIVVGDSHWCTSCSGTGLRLHQESSFGYDGFHVDSRYVRLLQQELPSAQFALTPFNQKNFAFRFDGGFGVVVALLRRGLP